MVCHYILTTFELTFQLIETAAQEVLTYNFFKFHIPQHE